MESLLSIFLSTSLICFAGSSVLGGLFMAYIGRGKTRTFGIVLSIIGVVAFGAFWLFFGTFLTIMLYGIVSIIGAIVGLGAAALLLLLCFMLL